MKKTLLPLVCVSAIAMALSPASFAQAPQPPKINFPQASPAATLKQRVGLTDIEVNYSRPSAKGREVFGDLVPYDQVWRTGANNATRVSFSTAVKFGGADVPAGSYALFSIPGRDEWTVILNKVTGQWGAYRYDAANDVARVKVKPETLATPVETFTIEVNDVRDAAANLLLVWQKVRVPVKLELDLVGMLVPQIEAATAPNQNPDPRLLFGAALFYLDNNLDLAKANAWVDAALEKNPTAFYMQYHRARILAKRGDKAGARAAAEKSIELAKQAGGAVADEYTHLNQKLVSSLGQ